MEEDEPSVIDVDPAGDVILEVCCPDGKRSLLVSSKVLTLASPAFADLCNSQFNTDLGNHLTAAKPSIPLSDDNAKAIIVFCNAIHHRTNEVPRTLELTCLENLAVICDKYDCASTLQPWSAMWLQARIEAHAPEELNKLLFAAYVLDSPDAFSRISWEILMVQVGPFVHLPGLTDNDLVTGNILGMSMWL